MTESMLKRVAMTILPEMHHGLTNITESPEAAAWRVARKIVEIMREPTGPMIDAGEAAPRDPGSNVGGAEAAYVAMIEAALAEGAEASN